MGIVKDPTAATNVKEFTPLCCKPLQRSELLYLPRWQLLNLANCAPQWCTDDQKSLEDRSDFNNPLVHMNPCDESELTRYNNSVI
jgi:hypothetical protein